MTDELAAHGGKPFARELIPLHRSSFGQEEIGELRNCLESGWITRGPLTSRFEKEFSAYLNGDKFALDQVIRDGAKPMIALGMNSCTAALHTALIVAGIGPGDEVITSPITFAASVNVIEHVGATPVLADVHHDTLCIDEAAIARAITEKTRAIIPVHFAGHPCEMDKIARIAREHNLIVIEDCAHAIEAEFRGIPMGAIGDFGCFSFYATKNLTTGEGGMLTCNDEETIRKARVASLHGMSFNAWQRYEGREFLLYDIEMPGFKYNMYDIQAAIGIHQLAKLDGFWQSRKWLHETYCEKLRDVPEIRPLAIRPHVKSAYHLFVARLDLDRVKCDRNEFLTLLLHENVQGYVHFNPVFEFSYYREKYGWRRDDFPVAAEAGACILTLPLFPTMSKDELTSVVGAVKKVLKAVRR